MDKEYVNKSDYDEKFWKHNYCISILNVGEYLVNADHEQDAIDYLVDYIEEKYPGMVMTEEDIEEEEYLEEYVTGGNHSIYLNFGWHEMVIDQIK